MKVAVIKYNSGNVLSVLYALERLGVNASLTDDLDEIQSADKVIFPGQGEASNAMKYLKARNLDQLILDLKQPFFGICLGQQLLCAQSISQIVQGSLQLCSPPVIWDAPPSKAN